MADEYSNFVAVDDLKLNGRLTLGENTADNGGARIALMAIEHMIADDKTGKDALKIDGYTPEQRFFLGFARVWCEKRRPEYKRKQVTTNPHSPGKWRVDGVVQNMPEFQKAWGCKPGQPMVAANACHVWCGSGVGLESEELTKDRQLAVQDPLAKLTEKINGFQSSAMGEFIYYVAHNKIDAWIERQ